MTPVELIHHCSQALTQAGVAYGQGTLNAEDEAAWLVLWALKLPLDTDTSTLNSPVSEAEYETVLDYTHNIQHRSARGHSKRKGKFRHDFTDCFYSSQNSS